MHSIRRNIQTGIIYDLKGYHRVDKQDRRFTSWEYTTESEEGKR